LTVVVFLVCCCWWCGGVVLGRLWSWPSKFHPLWCFYTGLCYLGAWHLGACIWWVCCCGLACPSRLSWDIFTRELGDKLNILMIIYSGLVFLDCHLVITILGDLLFIFWLQVPRKRKEEKKERICNL
jgi:hypothetical protein